MPPPPRRNRSFRHLILPALMLPALAGAASAIEYRRADLIERPPFSRSDTRPGKNGADQPGPLELRGFFGMGGSIEVSLTVANTRQSQWIRLGDRTSPWVLEAADPVAGTATVSCAGHRLHLTLAREAGSTPARPSAPRARPGKLSRAAGEALRRSMTERLDALRRDHPEFFDGTPLSPAQAERRTAAIEAAETAARDSAAQAFPTESGALNTANPNTPDVAEDPTGPVFTDSRAPDAAPDSAEDRIARQRAHEAALKQARLDHPEYFNDSPLTHDQIRERQAYLKKIHLDVRAGATR